MDKKLFSRRFDVYEFGYISRSESILLKSGHIVLAIDRSCGVVFTFFSLTFMNAACSSGQGLT
jgi:hypothetical protein